MKRIGIIDYGIGNINSVYNMILKARGIPYIIKTPEELVESEIVILPGVGSYDNAVKRLKEKGFFNLLINHHNNNKPLLGICLGFQLMFDSSEEGSLKGLGIITGKVCQFKKTENYKIMNMGWNKLDSQHKLFGSFDSNKFYYVHKYYAVPNNKKQVIGTSFHGVNFCAATAVKNSIGVQFHPEKSHNYGLKFFEQFIKLYAIE